MRLLGNSSAVNDECIIDLLEMDSFPQLIEKLLNFPYEPVCKETVCLVANIVNNHKCEIQSRLESSCFRHVIKKSVNHVLGLF